MTKIALLSDIHFGKDSRCTAFAIPGQKIDDEVVGASSLYDGLESKLSEYNPDYIFCTGDLTSSGKPLEYKYCIEKLYELAKKSSVNVSNVIYCIGNHDVDWALMSHSINTGEYKDLNRDFSDDEASFLNDYYSCISHAWLQNVFNLSNIRAYREVFSSVGPIPMTGIIDHEDVLIFVLNSGFLCSTEQDIIHGKITSTQLEWLKDELKKHEDDEKWKIVILHHHPFGYNYPIVYHEYSTLEEGPQLQRLCGLYGVNLVIHGHYHFPRAETRFESGWNNAVTFISSGSLSVNQAGRLNGEIPNTFHFVQLEEYPTRIRLLTYEYSLSGGWNKVSHFRDMLPLDHEMYLGEVSINDIEAKAIIEKFPINTPISYDNIDSKLKYISISHLNELIKEVHGLNLSGEFPKYIQVHKSVREERISE